MTERVDWVDNAKAIGILLVVYGHVARGLFEAGFIANVQLYKLVDSIIYSFHMPLFFFLSGLFVVKTLNRKGTKGFVFSKVDTILYPYILWSILQGSVEFVLADYTNGDVALGSILNLWVPRAQFWFLYALFFVAIVTAMVLSFIPRIFQPWCVLVAVVLYCVEPYVSYVPAVQLVCNNLIYFLIGVYFSKVETVLVWRSGAALVVLGVGFVLAQLVFHLLFDLNFHDRGVGLLLLATLSIVFVVQLSHLLSRQAYSRAIAAIGSASMAIYLMHILVGSGARVVLVKGVGVESLPLLMIACCVVSVVGPMLVFQGLQRFKIRYIFSAPVSKLMNLCSKAVFFGFGEARRGVTK